MWSWYHIILCWQKTQILNFLPLALQGHPCYKLSYIYQVKIKVSLGIEQTDFFHSSMKLSDSHMAFLTPLLSLGHCSNVTLLGRTTWSAYLKKKSLLNIISSIPLPGLLVFFYSIHYYPNEICILLVFIDLRLLVLECYIHKEKYSLILFTSYP